MPAIDMLTIASYITLFGLLTLLAWSIYGAFKKGKK
jgi:hypothetical protein